MRCLIAIPSIRARVARLFQSQRRLPSATAPHRCDWQRPPALPTLEKQNTTKSLSSRRREYVGGVADRRPAAPNIASLFLRRRTFSAGSAT
jgi:hypothetical protein